MRIIKLTRTLDVFCEAVSTRYGFKHTAKLVRNGYIDGESAKCCYYNRTWERYEFESVLEALERKATSLTKYERRRFRNAIKNGGKVEEARIKKELKTIGMVMAMGALLNPDQKSKNDFQARILKAGLGSKGLIMPEDWGTLSEDEKEKRLSGIMAQLA